MQDARTKQPTRTNAKLLGFKLLLPRKPLTWSALKNLVGMAVWSLASVSAFVIPAVAARRANPSDLESPADTHHRRQREIASCPAPGTSALADLDTTGRLG